MNRLTGFCIRYKITVVILLWRCIAIPAKTVFDKDTVAQAAFRIVERDGQSALNARSLAKEAGCSTQPIYLRYPDMSAVRKEVIKLAREVYGGYISDGLRLKDSLFEGYLSAYIRFAREKPKLFGLLFMSDLGEDADDGLKDAIVGKISEVAGYDKDTSEKFFFAGWFFAHGIATQLACGYIKWSEEESDAFLEEEFGALKKYYGDKKK